MVPSGWLLPWMSARQDTSHTPRRPPARAKSTSRKRPVPAESLHAGPRHLPCSGLGVSIQLRLQHPPSRRPQGGVGEVPTLWHRHHPCWDGPGKSEIPWRGSCGPAFLILTPAPHRGDEASAPAPPGAPTPMPCPAIAGSTTCNQMGSWDVPHMAWSMVPRAPAVPQPLGCPPRQAPEDIPAMPPQRYHHPPNSSSILCPMCSFGWLLPAITAQAVPFLTTNSWLIFLSLNSGSSTIGSLCPPWLSPHPFPRCLLLSVSLPDP